MLCPDCNTDLGSAARCSCGWFEGAKEYASTLPFYQCGFYPCRRRAIARVKKGNAWVNCCPEHNDEFYQKRANETCVARGLKTTAEKRAWVLERMKKLSFRPEPNHEREPGED